MANRRMISKSISTSTKLAEVSTFAKLLFTWIIPHCDDYGHLDATPRIIKGLVVPLCDETIEDVSNAIEELIDVGLLDVYEANGRSYLEIVKWEDHQTFRNDRERIGKYPGRELEREIEEYYAMHLHELEKGLQLVKRQFHYRTLFWSLN